MIATDYYETDYPLDELESYKSLGGWLELFHRVKIAYAIWVMMFGVIVMIGSAGGAPVTWFLLAKFGVMAFIGAVAMTIIMIALHHKNPRIRQVAKAIPPLFVIGMVLLA